MPCFGKKIQIYPRTIRKCVMFRIVGFHIADRNFRKNIFICVNSGKTEYQTTKASKARRSASFERRPSRRYSRRTMQNRGENSSGKSDTSHYTQSASIIITCTYSRWNLNPYCVFLCVCVCTGQLNPHE